MDIDFVPGFVPTPGVTLEPERGIVAARYADVAVTASRMASMTREEVEAAYVHPEPLEPFGARFDLSSNALAFLESAKVTGWSVGIFGSRGTTRPTWRVSLPASGGPPIDASQYHGDLVECIVLVGRHPQRGQFIAVWHDGKTKGGVLHPKNKPREALGITELGARITA